MEPTSREEQIKFLQEAIELRSLEVKLQKLNSRLMIERAKEMQAISMIANFTKPKENESDNKSK
jgi:hypothetical protein